MWSKIFTFVLNRNSLGRRASERWTNASVDTISWYIGSSFTGNLFIFLTKLRKRQKQKIPKPYQEWHQFNQCIRLNNHYKLTLAQRELKIELKIDNFWRKSFLRDENIKSNTNSNFKTGSYADHLLCSQIEDSGRRMKSRSQESTTGSYCRAMCSGTACSAASPSESSIRSCRLASWIGRRHSGSVFPFSFWVSLPVLGGAMEILCWKPSWIWISVPSCG